MEPIRPLLKQIEEERLRRSVYYLAKDRLPYRKLDFTRLAHTENTLYEADKWIDSQLDGGDDSVEREARPVRALGYDAAKPVRHRYAPPPPDAPLQTAYTLYAKKSGRRHLEEIILLLAHKDSQSWVDSPGAYDNGVGTAAVLEIARVLAS